MDRAAFVIAATRHLANADSETRADRAERATWIAGLGQPEDGWVGFDGSPTMMEAWAELQWTYVEGCFLGCVLTGQVFVEYLIAGLLAFRVPDQRVNGLGFAALTDAAVAQGWLSNQEKREFDEIRQARNREFPVILASAVKPLQSDCARNQSRGASPARL